LGGTEGLRLLLDTHIWLWSLGAPARLTKRVAAAIRAHENELWVSPISIWEALLLVERGRVSVDGDPREYFEAAWSRAQFHEATMNREVASRSRSVRLPHQDPADRFLAATAQVYDLTLVTADRRLLAGKGYRTLANR